MSVNKFRPHLIILPEDDANRQIAVGFNLNSNPQQVHVESEIGGWIKVVETFLNSYAQTMRQFEKRFVVLVIDFDDDPNRLTDIRKKIPEDISDRVFVIGCLKEPEDLKRANLGTFEQIGRALADDCLNGTDLIWNHGLLANNAGELARLRHEVCAIVQ